MSLPWHLLERPPHLGVQSLVRDLNRLYRSTPALHQLDCDGNGFEWLVTDDANHSVFAWLRKGRDPQARCVVVVNFTPEVRHDYRIRVPFAGTLARGAQHRRCRLWRQQCGERGPRDSCCDTRQPGASPCPPAACCRLSRS